MPRHVRSARACFRLVALLVALSASVSVAQARQNAWGLEPARHGSTSDPADRQSSRLAVYVDPSAGLAADDLERRALASNAELGAARLDVDRARARLDQAGLRANPSVELEHGNGRVVGEPGEHATTIGFTVPLDVAGERGRRRELARAELAVAEAELADRERRLAADVASAYLDALVAARELETYERLAALDAETSRVVEARVNEGDAAPIELNLIRVETDLLRSQSALAEGRLRAAMLRLRNLTGAAPTDDLRLRQEIDPSWIAARRGAVPSRDRALDAALRTRPDLRAARLAETAARAGLRLAEAGGKPDVAVFGRYTTGRSITDLPVPFEPAPDRERQLAAGVTISLPVFDRNQGGCAEAAFAVTQAERRVAFAEAAVRTDVESAYARYEAALSAAEIYEQGVLSRSSLNVATIREAYQLGAFRVTDLLAEQRRFVDAERDYTTALAEARRALADLETAVGRSPEETAPETKEP